METMTQETDGQTRACVTAGFLAYAKGRMAENVSGSESVLNRAEQLAERGMHRMAIGEAMSQIYRSTLPKNVSDRINDSAIALLKQLRQLGAR